MKADLIDIYHGDVISDDFFHNVINGGGQGVILKCTQGVGYVDPAYSERMKRLLSLPPSDSKAGLYAGDYMFGLLDGTICKQAMFYVNQSMIMNTVGTIKPVFDLETEPSVRRLVWENDLEKALKMVKRLTGCFPIIYTGLAFYDEWLKDILPATTYSYWIADYGDGRGDNPVPNVPALLWQFTSDYVVEGERSGNPDGGGFDGCRLMPGVKWGGVLKG